MFSKIGVGISGLFLLLVSLASLLVSSPSLAQQSLPSLADMHFFTPDEFLAFTPKDAKVGNCHLTLSAFHLAEGQKEASGVNIKIEPDGGTPFNMIVDSLAYPDAKADEKFLKDASPANANRYHYVVVNHDKRNFGLLDKKELALFMVDDLTHQIIGIAYHPKAVSALTICGVYDAKSRAEYETKNPLPPPKPRVPTASSNNSRTDSTQIPPPNLILNPASATRATP